MYYKLIDATGHDTGIVQVNLETEEFEKLAKDRFYEVLKRELKEQLKK